MSSRLTAPSSGSPTSHVRYSDQKYPGFLRLVLYTSHMRLRSATYLVPGRSECPSGQSARPFRPLCHVSLGGGSARLAVGSKFGCIPQGLGSPQVLPQDNLDKQTFCPGEGKLPIPLTRSPNPGLTGWVQGCGALWHSGQENASGNTRTSAPMKFPRWGVRDPSFNAKPM